MDFVVIQETFVRREEEKKQMDKRGERMVSTLLVDFPCFELGTFLLEEVRLILGKTQKQLDLLLHKATGVTETLTKMLPERNVVRKVSCALHLWRYIVHGFAR